ncbi:MAG: hypothetical protein RLZZ248_287 [Bacteroidota bacterium]|jgi:hypothetical protein
MHDLVYTLFFSPWSTFSFCLFIPSKKMEKGLWGNDTNYAGGYGPLIGLPYF